MNDAALFDQIIVKIRTTSEASLVIHCLEEISSSSFSSTKIVEQQKTFRQLPKEIADIIIETFAKPANPTDQISYKRQINKLLNKLRTSKNIKLTLAFQPDDATITFFSDWIKKNVKQDILIDLQFDKSIVGGAQIIAGGVYKDYSVKKNLTNRFQIQRDEIMKLLE